MVLLGWSKEFLRLHCIGYTIELLVCIRTNASREIAVARTIAQNHQHSTGIKDWYALKKIFQTLSLPVSQLSFVCLCVYECVCVYVCVCAVPFQCLSTYHRTMVRPLLLQRNAVMQIHIEPFASCTFCLQFFNLCLL